MATLTLPDMVLRHELAHAVMALRQQPKLSGRVIVKVGVEAGAVYGCILYPNRRDAPLTTQQRVLITLAGPAYCELIGAPKLGAMADLANALGLCNGNLDAVKAALGVARAIVRQDDFRAAVEGQAVARLEQGVTTCWLRFTL